MFFDVISKQAQDVDGIHLPPLRQFQVIYRFHCAPIPLPAPDTRLNKTMNPNAKMQEDMASHATNNLAP